MPALICPAMRALELMKTHVVTATPRTSLSEAVDLMDLYQVTGIPVVDDSGHLCGMLTESDVVRALGGPVLPGAERRARAGRTLCEAGNEPLGPHMTSPAVSVEEATEIDAAARLMLRRGLKRLPVTAPDGRVVGTLARLDVLQAIFEGFLAPEHIESTLEE